MDVRSYAYIDGESHYRRSSAFWEKLHPGVPLEKCWQRDSSPNTVRVNHKFKFFWDTHLPDMLRNPRGNHPLPASLKYGIITLRKVYFTAGVGGDDELHHARLEIRKAELEPYLVKEPTDLYKNRENAIEKYGVIEKAKGVDIGLTVRLLDDTFNDNFDIAVLFTSDVDYLPAIEVVRRSGKRVIVCGYRDGLGANSPLEVVPDDFIDMGAFMKEWYAPPPDA